VVAGFVVGVVGLDDEGGTDFGGVLSLALILNVGVEPSVVVGCVSNLLESTVRKLDGVAAGHSLAVAGFLLLEGGAVVGVLHPVGEAVGLGGRLVSLVVVRIMTVGVDGGGQGGEGHHGKNSGA